MVLLICVFNLPASAKLPGILDVVLCRCVAHVMKWCNLVNRDSFVEPVLGHFIGHFPPMNQADYRVYKREGALDEWRCQYCEAVAARPVEPHIHDPMLNEIERPDRITSQDGIVWGFVKSSFEIL